MAAAGKYPTTDDMVRELWDRQQISDVMLRFGRGLDLHDWDMYAATLTDPAPTAFLEKFGDSSIDFELVAWSEKMSSRPRRYKSDLNFLIEKHLREAGIEIPNPQRDLHIRSGVIKVETVGRDKGNVTPLEIGAEDGAPSLRKT